MRKCKSCGDPIEGRRKDAKFCAKSACRGEDYRKRHATSAAPARSERAHAAAAVLTCLCGRRYHLEITSLDGKAAPALAPAAAGPETVTQTVSSTDQKPSEAAAVLPTPPPAVANSSEQFVAAPASPTTPTAASPERPQPAEAGPVAAGENSSAPVFRTIELYFTDVSGRRLPFWDAVARRAGGRWRVRGHARPALGLVQSAGTGLGGTPGRWHDFYRNQKPSEFGLDPDAAVLCWDDDDRRAYVAEVELLEESLGFGWRTKLRAHCGEAA